MGVITVTDDCLAPARFIYLRYKGHDPYGVVEKITDTIRPYFHVSASGTNQTRINWDEAGDPVKFYSTWWVKKEMSAYTKMWIHMKIQGSKSKADNVGEFTLQMNAFVETKFEGFGLLLKPIWLIYSYLFYDRARRGFLDACRNMTVQFRNEIKKHFNLEATNVPSASGWYG
ncbi:hypothetical protein HY501_02815 [Candidatus Woesearchaeota archaeon]|nr:hypothetical protein [Candidatus Woesearchaeota archaeon]